MSEPCCPRCSVVLQPLDIGEVGTDSCPSCGGLLVDQRDVVGMLEVFAAALVQFFDADAPIDRVDDPWGTATCPDCGGAMVKNGYQGSPNVMVDRCAGCGVIWIDGGELDVMAQLYLRSERSFQSNVDRIQRLAEYLRPASYFGDISDWTGFRGTYRDRPKRSDDSRRKYREQAPGSRLGLLVVALLDEA
ncbi:MAG: zf-TFIIB domain-containing protein [Alphaproteobacteria bacterium]|nr:zf-TFIIB domain-containing protein [Alphaproteobacteria bacterium]